MNNKVTFNQFFTIVRSSLKYFKQPQHWFIHHFQFDHFQSIFANMAGRSTKRRHGVDFEQDVGQLRSHRCRSSARSTSSLRTIQELWTREAASTEASKWLVAASERVSLDRWTADYFFRGRDAQFDKRRLSNAEKSVEQIQDSEMVDASMSKAVGATSNAKPGSWKDAMYGEKKRQNTRRLERPFDVQRVVDRRKNINCGVAYKIGF